MFCGIPTDIWWVLGIAVVGIIVGTIYDRAVKYYVKRWLEKRPMRK